MKKEPPKTKAKASAKAPVKTSVKTSAKVKAPTIAKAPPKNKKVASTRDMLWMLNKIFNDVSILLKQVQDELPAELELTGAQRQRLISARVRKWGFITKAWEVIDARPIFAPPQFSKPDMSDMMANAEKARQVLTLVEQLRRLLDDYLLTCNNSLYLDALRIYRSLQEQARARLPGAEELFQILRQFFMLHRRRRGAGAQPTEHELEREFHSLLHGHSDGELLIKNESPHMVGGEHEVVENVSKRGKRGAEIKVKEEE